MPIFGSKQSASAVIGFATISTYVMLDIFANMASGDIDDATKNSKSVLLRNVQYVATPCVLLALWIVRYKAEKIRAQHHTRVIPTGHGQSPSAQPQVTTPEHHTAPPDPGRVTDLEAQNVTTFDQTTIILRLSRYLARSLSQWRQNTIESNLEQVSPAAESQNSVAFDQASLTSKHWWKFTRSFGFLRQLCRNIRKRTSGPPETELNGGVTASIKAATQSKSDEMIETSFNVGSGGRANGASCASLISNPPSISESPQQDKERDVSTSMTASPQSQADETMAESSGTSQAEDREHPPKILEMECTLNRQRRKRKIRRRKKSSTGPLRNLGSVNESWLPWA